MRLAPSECRCLRVLSTPASDTYASHACASGAASSNVPSPSPHHDAANLQEQRPGGHATSSALLLPLLQKELGIPTAHEALCVCRKYCGDPIFTVSFRLESIYLRWYFIYSCSTRAWYKVSFEGDIRTFSQHFANLGGALHCDRLLSPRPPISLSTPYSSLATPQRQSSSTDLLASLPSELRDAIFGQYSTSHALAVDFSTDCRTSQGLGEYLQHDDLPLPPRAILTLDGTIASTARQTSAYLRREYQSALRHLIRREGVRKVLLLTSTTSSLRRSLVTCLIPEARIRSLIQDIGLYNGILEIYVVFCDPYTQLSNADEQYPFGMPEFSTSTVSVVLRRYVFQPIFQIGETLTWPPAATPFARIIELIPGSRAVVRLCVRHTMPQMVCAILNYQHVAGAQAIDQLLWHNQADNAASSEEARVLERLLSPPGEVLQRHLVIDCPSAANGGPPTPPGPILTQRSTMQSYCSDFVKRAVRYVTWCIQKVG
ncbi:hypothetical protein LTR37_008975 [Vermiconidia calcicola]|uniref:Uncharacterized protein n=1 Tax=Vermiconidia calcicola TaxID=1690605 RepID=A0ACC3N9U4_9PEZI|nr:hypothetical protein LTR37_008975 [Vermiconidia calcicola]